jgi:hypothetical protein
MIVRDEVAAVGMLDVEEGLCLLESGLDGLARRFGCSVRTARRRLSAARLDSSALVLRTRIRMTNIAIAMGLPLSIAAKWLGFADAVTYRRFICRVMGSSVRELRRRVRESAVSVSVEGLTMRTSILQDMPNREGDECALSADGQSGALQPGLDGRVKGADPSSPNATEAR